MLIIVRHGRTEANAAGLLLGRADPELDAVGRAQAAALAPVVAGASRVVCSPLRRTMATAEVLGLPLSVDERWIELDYGQWDGRPVSEVPGAEWERWRADTGFRPPGGESLADLGRRVRAACDDLADEARDTDVVVVTHVSPIKAAVGWAIGVGDEVAWRLHVVPAAVARVVVRPQGPVLTSFNEVGHLPPAN
ncbi:MAG TPA: histidine phosphatase family protein [Acidimicrobiales bacterium]|nr:histidine phosphatase family protein [Acidimicrobiales bacterium]